MAKTLREVDENNGKLRQSLAEEKQTNNQLLAQIDELRDALDNSHKEATEIKKELQGGIEKL